MWARGRQRGEPAPPPEPCGRSAPLLGHPGPAGRVPPAPPARPRIRRPAGRTNLPPREDLAGQPERSRYGGGMTNMPARGDTGRHSSPPRAESARGGLPRQTEKSQRRRSCSSKPAVTPRRRTPGSPGRCPVPRVTWMPPWGIGARARRSWWAGSGPEPEAPPEPMPPPSGDFGSRFLRRQELQKGAISAGFIAQLLCALMQPRHLDVAP